MRRLNSLTMHPALRRFTLWLLLLALPIYGAAGAVQQMLGPVHRHTERVAAVPAAMPPSAGELAAAQAVAAVLQGLSDLRLWAHAHIHASNHATHAHQHSAFKRHRHDPVDQSVVLLGGDLASAQIAAELGAAAAAGSATLPLGLAISIVTPLPPAGRWRWSTEHSAAWRDADSRRLDRPPCAVPVFVIDPSGAPRCRA